MSKDRFSTWPDEFARKLMAPEDAAGLVQPGDCITIPIGSLTPNLVEAIHARGDELHDIDITTCAPFLDPGWFEPGHPSFRVHVEVFNTVIGRSAVDARRADFISVPFSRRFKGEDERGGGPYHADVVLLGVSPPDRFGFCSFGSSMWNKKAYAKRARTVLAEMFGAYPRTGGDNFIHVSEIDAFVEGGVPTRAFPVREAPEFPTAIAGYVGELVHNGDTIQIGTGAMTAQLVVQGAFDDKEDLGVHSEISVPGINRLVYEGIVNGSRKNLHPNRYVTTALVAATPEDVDFVHENPVFEVYDVEYVNDPKVIAQNDNMVAINNAMTIDLTGQIASESIGGQFYSGPGGQFEFQLGALSSKGGRAITVLPSTTRDGSISKIVAQHPPGEIITVPRQYADYVVTEHGIASLFGKTDRERAAELISIAHPDHRAELRRQAATLLGLRE